MELSRRTLVRSSFGALAMGLPLIGQVGKVIAATPSGKKRVLVIANKWWECEPLTNILLNDYARPATLGWPALPSYPHQHRNPSTPTSANSSLTPRLIFYLENINVEIWCISDLLEHLPDQGKYQSSSEQKMSQMPKIFTGKPADFVIAFGTAAYPITGSNENGNVVIGSRAFLHDGHPVGDENIDSKWHDGPFDQVLESNVDVDIFNKLTGADIFTKSVLDEFIIPPLNPALQGKVLANRNYVAVSEINVSNYNEYNTKDAETIKAYSTKNDINMAGSLETTHGLIRVSSQTPFIFVSGITDRYLHFSDDVNPRPYAQNTVAAHNAGIIVAFILPQLNALLV